MSALLQAGPCTRNASQRSRMRNIVNASHNREEFARKVDKGCFFLCSVLNTNSQTSSDIDVDPRFQGVRPLQHHHRHNLSTQRIKKRTPWRQSRWQITCTSHVNKSEQSLTAFSLRKVLFSAVGLDIASWERAGGMEKLYIMLLGMEGQSRTINLA